MFNQTPCDTDYYNIGDYGVIGDLHTIALVNPVGGIDWCCLPYFDSSSLFARILDRTLGGYFRLSPAEFTYTHHQYLGKTNILQTNFYHMASEFLLTDFMPIASKTGEKTDPNRVFICRRIACMKGVDVEVDVVFDPQPDYARRNTDLQFAETSVTCSTLDFQLLCSHPVTWKDQIGRLKLSNGDVADFILVYGKPLNEKNLRYWVDQQFIATRNFWEQWIEKCLYKGKWRGLVERSALALKLLVFQPTGAIVAAPTTSLPEAIGHERNWDYRFCWLRDSALALNALFLLGYMDEAKAYIKWISTCIDRSEEIRILYPIGEADTTAEETLAHLEGYRHSRPVRIGNAATEQLQLDIYGESLDAFFLYSAYGEGIDESMWKSIQVLADQICERWNLTDEGIWEVRDGKRHFTYSKLMCWVGLDRAIRLAEEYEFPSNITQWRLERDAIAEFLTHQCVHPQYRFFTQSAGSQDVDASNLLILHMSFLDASDELIINTIDETISQLTQQKLVYRYKNEDGMGGVEGAFNICTFWLIEALAMSDRLPEALDYFNNMLAMASPLGLYAEQTEPDTGQPLGNFPQAFTHIGLIHAALTLNQVLVNDEALASKDCNL